MQCAEGAPRPPPPTLPLEAAARSGAVPTAAVADASSVARKPAHCGFGAWLDLVLSGQRGVVAALPPAAWRQPCAPAERVVALAADKREGCAAWWAAQLARATRFAPARSHGTRAGSAWHVTEAFADTPWLPDERTYGGPDAVDAFELECLAAAGVALALHPGTRERLSEQPHLSQRLALEMEAAALGLAPAVLATFAAHVGAQDGPATVPRLAMVTQAPSFRLADVLAAHVAVQRDPALRPRVDAAAAQRTQHAMGSAVARCIRALADARLLKLNVGPDTVVFCPKLFEATDGDLEATGFAFFHPERGDDVVKGQPRLVNFDPAFTRRVPASVREYDADAAYALMMLQFLSASAARFGSAAAAPLAHAAYGRSPEGAVVLDPLEKPEDFEQLDVHRALARCGAAPGRVEAFVTLLQQPGLLQQPLLPALREAAAEFAARARPGGGALPLLGCSLPALVRAATGTRAAPCAALAQRAP